VSTNEYKGNYYTSLSAWKINSIEAPKDKKYSGKKEFTQPLAQEYEDSGLPF
jgi:hypothetical protein